MHVSCSSHTWFIYNLNTVLLLAFIQYYDMIHMYRLAISVMAHFLFTPLADSLLPPFPFTYLESLLLCGAILSTLVPGYSWTDLPSPHPPSSLPIPDSHYPRSIVHPTKTTSPSRLHMVRNMFRDTKLGELRSCSMNKNSNNHADFSGKV